jgi:hypothetical protein
MSEQLLLQAEVPQFLLSSAQQKNFPGVPRLAAEGNSSLNFALAKTAFKFLSTTITAAGIPSMMRL